VSFFGVFTQVPITFYPNKKSDDGIYNLDMGKLIDVIRTNMDLEEENLGSVKVQIIYNEKQELDSILVHTFSNKYWCSSVTQIKLNESYEVIDIDYGYEEQAKEMHNQPTVWGNACPDEEVEFVAATPNPEVPSAKQVILDVVELAKNNTLKTVTLIGKDANKANYTKYLDCPKLKGFFSVGHGSSTGIVLYDGTLYHDTISSLYKEKFSEKTVILLNSCRVHNTPLKDSFAIHAKAQKYIGGITTLNMIKAENVSRCFWTASFLKENMNTTLTKCVLIHDPTDTWGISGNGSDVFNSVSDKQLKFLS